MITIWDLHYDEFLRLNFFIKDSVRYVGDDCPQSSKLVISEGSRYKIPSSMISKAILYPCVKEVGQLIAQGYNYAFTKDEWQRSHFGDNAITLPPVFGEPVPERERTEQACSLIHFLESRDRKAAEFLKRIGVINYGLPDNPCTDVDVLSKTKFLVHPKTIGYLCNAVIKAMNALTPVIFTEESYTFGYQDYLTPGVSCIVVKNEEEAVLAMKMNDSEYLTMQKNIASSVNRIKDSYDEIKKKTEEFIGRVWGKA